MNTGAFLLARLIVRRDRVRLALWTVGLVAMVALSAVSVRDVFPTQADLDAAAASSQNPAILAFQGPDQALDTLGGQIAFQIGAPGLVFVGLMALLLTGRMTRAEEEAGRLELVRSLPVGSTAPMAAATLVVATASVVIGGLTAVALIAFDLPVAGSINFGLGYAATGIVFAAVTLVTAQVSDNARLAGGLAGCVLGLSFVLRAIGDMTDGPARLLSWCSPIGWVQGARPFAGERWWPLLLTVLVAGLLGALAVELQGRRDLGAGLVEPRPGPARAVPTLASPLALAFRLQRGAIIGWTAGVAFFGLVYGALTSAIEDFVRDNPDLAEFLQTAGGDLTDSYLATAARTTALIGGGFAVQSMVRLRTEETNLRTEPVLATPVSRRSYWAAHVAVAMIGSVVVLSVTGLLLGASAAIAVGDASLVVPTTGATLVYLVPTWVLIGFAALLIGWLPRYSVLAWAMLVIAFVVAMFGPILDLPSWMMRLSPFERLPRMPAEPWQIGSTATLLAIGFVLGGVGLITYRRRDIAG